MQAEFVPRADAAQDGLDLLDGREATNDPKRDTVVDQSLAAKGLAETWA